MSTLVPMPDSVAEVLGPAASDLHRWILDMTRSVAATRPELEERFDAMDRRFDAIERRFDAIDARFDALLALVDQRLDASAALSEHRYDAFAGRFDQRLGAQALRTDARFDSLEARLTSVDLRLACHMRWSIALLAVFAAMVTALLASATYLP